MNRKLEKFGQISLIIFLSIVIFFALMYIFSVMFGTKKIDATDLHRFALSPSSEKSVSAMQTPINVNLYFSDNLGEEYPDLGLHSQYVLRLLDKYKSLSDGKININIKNPEPYSLIEYEAQNKGIRGFPDNNGENNLYFGATFNNSNGEEFAIPYFSVQRQNYTEYDISRILAKLNKMPRKKVGLASFGGNISDWQIIKKIKNDYNLVTIDPKAPIIPKDMQTLIVFAPQRVSATFAYAVDQYVMRGGNLILLIDPYPQKLLEKYPYIKNNHVDLSNLLQKFGIKFEPENVVTQNKKKNFDKIADILQLEAKAENIKLPQQLGKVSKINLSSAGELSIDAAPEVKYIPVITFDNQTGTLKVKQIIGKDTEEIADMFQKDDKKHMIAVWLEGYFESSFSEISEAEKENFQYLSSSLKPSKILIIADTDFAADEQWNATQYQSGATVYDQIASANNADFLLSAIDDMNQNQDLAAQAPKYMMEDDPSVVEQLIEKTYQKHGSEYNQKLEEILKIKQDLNDFRARLKNNETGMTLLKIQELDSYGRRLQNFVNDIKRMNYQIQQEIAAQMNKIIILVFLLLPMLLFLLLRVVIFSYDYTKQKKIIRKLDE